MRSRDVAFDCMWWTGKWIGKHNKIRGKLPAQYAIQNLYVHRIDNIFDVAENCKDWIFKFVCKS